LICLLSTVNPGKAGVTKVLFDNFPITQHQQGWNVMVKM